MSAREHLDQLDKLRAEGTPGEWNEDGPGSKAVWVGRTMGDSQLVATCRNGHADAALIVAAVNALPKHTAALRAVLDLADQWDTDDDARLNRNRIAKSAAAKALRDAVGVLDAGGGH